MTEMEIHTKSSRWQPLLQDVRVDTCGDVPMKFADGARRRMRGHTVIQQLLDLRLRDALEMPRNATHGRHNTCKPNTIFKNAQVRL